ncbi:MAG: hypothetical protein IBJ03_06465, partial [Gemmatimonadaceae bacterium]|nr:hypothetical protein [Gemmatimonadaceae bacterium]
MNPAEIDALVASAQAAKAAGQPLSSLKEETAASPAPAARAPQLTDFEQTMLGNTEVPIGVLPGPPRPGASAPGPAGLS